MTIFSWPIWLALAALFTIGFVVLTKRTKAKSPPGHRDNSIHSKPLFQMATVILLVVFGVLIVTV